MTVDPLEEQLVKAGWRLLSPFPFGWHPVTNLTKRELYAAELLEEKIEHKAVRTLGVPMIYVRPKHYTRAQEVLKQYLTNCDPVNSQ